MTTTTEYRHDLAQGTPLFLIPQRGEEPCPCAECGQMGPRRTGDRTGYWRTDGRPYGTSGYICRRCYDTIRRWASKAERIEHAKRWGSYDPTALRPLVAALSTLDPEPVPAAVRLQAELARTVWGVACAEPQDFAEWYTGATVAYQLLPDAEPVELRTFCRDSADHDWCRQQAMAGRCALYALAKRPKGRGLPDFAPVDAARAAVPMLPLFEAAGVAGVPA